MLVACTVVLLGAGGCVLPYRPPSADEPHAVLKIRRSYSESAGALLRESATVDERSVLVQEVDSQLAAASRTDALLVHPGPATVKLSSAFGSYSSRQVEETYTEQVPYRATESYSCGSYRSYRTCTRSVTRYRSELKQRWVTQTEFVPLGVCSSAVRFAPQVGRAYLIQYDYRASGSCSVRCLEQRAEAAGTFTNQPCPVPPAAK